MIWRLCPAFFLVAFILSLTTGCTIGSAPATATLTMPPPSDTPLPTPLPTDTPTTTPSATNTPSPTATETAAPPTPTPTRTPRPVTNTPRPTQTRTPQAPTALPPTQPPSAPGVDLVATRGGESCVNKFVSVSFPWQEGPDGRKMYFWDKSWSLYVWYSRPGIKPSTAKGVCDKQNQCRGFTADFCVYVDGGAPAGGTYESVAHVIIYSVLPNNTGLSVLTEFDTKFAWQIK